jgi:hypothetical protein
VPLIAMVALRGRIQRCITSARQVTGQLVSVSGGYNMP